MRITRLLASVLLTLLTCGALATTAAAEEKTKMLPESGITFTSKEGSNEWTVLSGGFTIKCSRGKGSGTIESANLGKFKTELEGCSVAGGTENCATVFTAKGLITSEGAYHFWLAKETLNGTATLVGALVLLPTETHFTCVILGLNQLVVFKGCYAALATPLNTLTKVTKDVFAQSGTGDQLITKVLPQEKTTEESCILLSSKNGGAFESAALVMTVENEKFKAGTTEVTVLLMNPEAKE